jgi:hypothetical protein
VVKKALLVAALVVAPGYAHAWQYVQMNSALGDQGMGVEQPATNLPGIAFVFGCESDRWRAAAVRPHGSKPIRLPVDGMVRFGFGTQLGPPGQWRARKGPGGLRVYEAPNPTGLARRMAQEEEKSKNAALFVQVGDANQRRDVVARFPLAGFRAAVREHLWKPCKLDVYFGEPATAAKELAPKPAE